MAAVLDVRPPGIDVPFRPGQAVTLTMAWPAGALTGRTFTSTLGGVALAVVSDGDDTLTVEATPAQTLAATGPAEWLLLEDVAGDDVPVMVGTWVPSDGPNAVTATTVEVTVGAAAADVTVQPGITAAVLAAAEARLRPQRVDWYASADWDRLAPPIVAAEAEAIVLWSNILFGASANHLCGVWEWDGLDGLQINQFDSLDGFVSPVLSATGNGATVTVQTPRPHLLAVGTLVGVAITGTSPPASANYTIAATPTATSFTFASAATGTWTAGTYTRVFSPARAWAACRLVGNRLTVKQWVDGEPEPDWADTRRASTATLPATLSGSGEPPPASGGAGLVVAHLGSTAAVSFADLSITSLD